MPTTPIYGLRYPAAADPADVPTDMGELATDVETALTTLAYAQITSNATSTATVEASATTIVTAPAITIITSQIILVQFVCATAITPVGNTVLFWLFEDGVSLGRMGYISPIASQSIAIPVNLVRRHAPAAGSRTYSIRVTVGAGTATLGAGAGGAGNDAPAFIRITRG